MQKKTINGIVFEVDMLELYKGLEVFANTAQFLGPTLLNMVAKLAGGKSLGDLDSGIALGELGKVLEGLTPEKLRYFCDVFAPVTRIEFNGAMMPLPGLMKTVLRGKIGTVVQWIWFAVQVNFADFLDGVLATSRPLADQASPEAQPSVSPMG